MDRPLLGTETACAPPSCAGAQHRRRRGLKRGGGSHAGGKYKHGTTVACFLKLQPISYERGSCLAHRRWRRYFKSRYCWPDRTGGAAPGGQHPPHVPAPGGPRGPPWWPPTCRLRPPENPAHVAERAALRPRGRGGCGPTPSKRGPGAPAIVLVASIVKPVSGPVQRRLTGAGVPGCVCSWRDVLPGLRPNKRWCRLPVSKHGPGVLRLSLVTPDRRRSRSGDCALSVTPSGDTPTR